MRTKAGEVTRTGSGRPGRERRRGTRQASLPRFCILAALENQPETAHVHLTFTESFFVLDMVVGRGRGVQRLAGDCVSKTLQP